MFGADDQAGRLAQLGFAVRFLRGARQTFFAVRQMSTAHGKVFFSFIFILTS
jgi:hypothetical protein